jgi:hypothetical protein
VIIERLPPPFRIGATFTRSPLRDHERVRFN